MGNAELIEPRDRGGDIVGAVIDVVGDADGVDAGEPQRLAADLRIGEKAFGGVRALWRQMQAAFQIAEHHVGLVQRRGNMPKRNGDIGDVHEVDVAGQNQLAGHAGVPRGITFYRATIAGRTMSPG